MASATSIAGQPSLIEWQQYRFLLLESPKAANLPSYLREMKKYGVTDLVRVCEPLYSAEDVRAAGISMAEMPYEDGASPPQEVITKWLNLVQSRFGGVKATDQNKPCIAVHCVAGLGRAPVLVALALIEGGLETIPAVDLIRQKRRGAINQKQLSYLESYEPTRRSGRCTIM